MILAERRPRPRSRLGALGREEPSEPTGARQELVDGIKADAVEIAALQDALAALDDPAGEAAALAAAQALAAEVAAFGALGTLRDTIEREKIEVARLAALLGEGLGSWEVTLDAEVPVALSRADWDRTRKGWYRTTGWPRDDRLFPKLCPPDAYVAQATRPEDDRCYVSPGAYLPTVTPYTEAEAGALRAKWKAEGLLSPTFVEAVIAQGKTVPAPETPDDSSPTWWYGTPWGQEVAVAFAPPYVRGQYGWEATQALQTGDAPWVLVADPHPYIVGLPRGEPAGSVSTFAFDRWDDRPRTRIRSPVVLVGRGERQGPYWHAPARGWVGHYEDAPDVAWWQEVVATIAREGAVQGLIQAVGAVATLGAASPLVQAGLTAAANFGAGPAVQGAQAAAGGVEAGVSEAAPSAVSEGGGAPPGPAAEAAAFLAEHRALAEVAIPALAPEQTNEVLVRAAEAAPYLELIGPVGKLYGLAFTELVLQAHAARAERDRLRLELERRRQALVSQPWFRAAQAAIVAATAILTAGALAAVNLGVGAANAALDLGRAAELARAARNEEEARLRAEEEALARQVGALENELERRRQAEAELAGARGRGLPGWALWLGAGALVLALGGGALYASRKRRAA